MDQALYAQIYDVEDRYWWSVGTRAIFREWLDHALGVSPHRILDLGCGTGALARELAGLGTVHGLDVSLEAIHFTRRRGVERLCVGSAEQLPYATGVFDAVAAADVVEHVDDGPALAEIVRVLRPGGLALVHVPAFPFLWGEHDEAAHHRRRYRRAQLRALIEEHGLAIERLSYVNCLVFPAAAVVRVLKRVVRRRRAGRAPSAELYDLPAWLNARLTDMLLLERAAMRHVGLPFGVSLLCLARKVQRRP
jgi:SAM-dependent methyltransferase